MSLRLILAVMFWGAVIPSSSLAQSTLAQLTAPAQQTTPTSTAVYNIDGVVVNSATGAPVNAALVQAIFQGARSSVLTQPDGKFHLTDVPQGPLNVSVEKPGFFSEQQLPQDFNMRTQLVAGPDTPFLVLKLVPEGVIYGRITDPDGLPVENLRVALLYGSVSDGRKNWLQRFGGQTTEDGEFRIFGIPPGSYYLRAGQNFDQASRAQGSFPVTYYPGRPDRDSAAVIDITPGAEVRADFYVAPTRFYRISGTVAGYSLGSQVSVQLLSSEIGGTNPGVVVNKATGAFRGPSVPAGVYVLRALTTTGNEQLRASVFLNVDTDIPGVHLALAPSVTIPVNVHSEMTHNTNATALNGAAQQQPPSVNVRLFSQTAFAGDQAAFAGMGLDGRPESRSLAVRNLEPGTYRAQITPNGLGYVASAFCGGANLLNEDLTVAPGSPIQPIEVVLRDDFASLGVSVSSDGHPSQAVVLLIPEQVQRSAINIRVDQTGHGQSSSVPPGEYRALAVDRSVDLAYRNSEVMREYAGREQFVRLPPGGHDSLNLELQKRGER
jgi:Carboxypeptidase regulatory-like domain